MMTLERFEHLASAYGADLRRWPEAEQVAARALLAAEPRAQASLEDMDELDALLDMVPRPVASADLRERVLANAAGAGLRPRGQFLGGLFGARRGWSTLAWMSGAGWTAAAFAGVVFGVSVNWTLTEDHRADAILYQASLDWADDTEVLDG